MEQTIVIKFAGDSGDGMQLVGARFTINTALERNNLSTFPDFPAEIRAPAGTLAGVSGFQIHFGNASIYTPGDEYDVLVAMNAAALKANVHQVRPGGTIIANTAGFNAKNLKLSRTEGNPLDDDRLKDFHVVAHDFSQLTKTTLDDTDLDAKSKERCKNLFVLGFLLWAYHRPIEDVLGFIDEKFASKPDLKSANTKVLKAGFYFGETTETGITRVKVAPAKQQAGRYRNIMGNEAIALGLVAASKKANLNLFYGSYPITPASDILHHLAGYHQIGVRTFQAEDEIAAACSAVGASYGGHLGVTGTSGPGMALKAETISLAAMLEIPLVVVNVQRAGPSTGMPTKTEQADLMQAMFGRNGECPLPVLAAKSPSDCFNTVFEATRIAVEHMTPVIVLSDGYIANGSEPWKFPQMSDLPSITPVMAVENDTEYQPYNRNEQLVRSWAVPGMQGLEHRLGGLEKDTVTGGVSYAPENHAEMVAIRAQKVEQIATNYGPLKLDCGGPSGKVLVIGWGSTYGAIQSAVQQLVQQNESVAHLHLRQINPLPQDLADITDNFEHIIVPEMNNGQLSFILKAALNRTVHSFNKIEGLPLSVQEIINAIQPLVS